MGRRRAPGAVVAAVEILLAVTVVLTAAFAPDKFSDRAPRDHRIRPSLWIVGSGVAQVFSPQVNHLRPVASILELSDVPWFNSSMGIPRMTMPTKAALRAMLDDPTRPMYAREICEAADLPEGTIYTLLSRLEKAGWMTSWMERIDESAEGRRARRYYQLSPDGAELARQALAVSYARSRRTAPFGSGLKPARGDA